MNIVAWDIGGAHVKTACIDATGRLRHIQQQPCRLWTGIEALLPILNAVHAAFPKAHHAITMSGEMVDCFASRDIGVRALLGAFEAVFKDQPTRVFSESRQLICLEEAKACPRQVASANWLVPGTWIGTRYPSALFLDIGSTTTDILIVEEGQPRPRAIGDHGRLRSQELIYTGVVRTPLMALGPSIDFQGQAIGVMAELFANTADLYRVLGELPLDSDQHPTLDHGPKTRDASLVRLARMVGSDVDDFEAQAWMELAAQFKAKQMDQIERGLPKTHPGPWILGGVGYFLGVALSERAKRPHMCLGDLMPTDDPEKATIAAPAAALALLASA